jgi:2-methylcitrate dehydratase PrpD
MGAAFRHAARVAVTTRDGRKFKREILHRRGSPENPLKPEEVEYKFRHVAKSCLTPENIEKVMQLVARLDTLASTSELISILAAPTAS